MEASGMTKKQLKKILSMYNEGISILICFASIIEVMKGKTSVEIAEAIIAFQHLYRTQGDPK
jgi:hypothetical protein